MPPLIYIPLKVLSFIKCFNLTKVVRTQVDLQTDNMKEKNISQATERHQHMWHSEMNNLLNNPQMGPGIPLASVPGTAAQNQELFWIIL